MQKNRLFIVLACLNCVHTTHAVDRAIPIWELAKTLSIDFAQTELNLGEADMRNVLDNLGVLDRNQDWSSDTVNRALATLPRDVQKYLYDIVRKYSKNDRMDTLRKTLAELVGDEDKWRNAMDRVLHERQGSLSDAQWKKLDEINRPIESAIRYVTRIDNMSVDRHRQNRISAAARDQQDAVRDREVILDRALGGGTFDVKKLLDVLHRQKDDFRKLVDSVTKEPNSHLIDGTITQFVSNARHPEADLREWMQQENKMKHMENFYNPKQDRSKARAATWYAYTKAQPEDPDMRIMHETHKLRNIPPHIFGYAVGKYLHEDL